jgi:hypothetical protein
MIIVAGGDSFIWGSELADSPHGGKYGYSRSTYPALLAKQANIDYVCAAYPGNANQAISRMAINSCSKDPFLFVTWTYPQRAEFMFNDEWKSINSWHTAEKQFSKHYFNHTNSEYFELYSTLKEILFLQQYCQINHIPHLFMTADNHFYQTENYHRRSNFELKNLYTQIDWQSWFFFPAGNQANETQAPRGFYQWAIENKYSIGADGHPLEDAHRDAALLIKEKFNELVKKSIQSN